MKSTLYKLGRSLDSVIGILSPQRALFRELARQQYQRQYAAAKAPRTQGDWIPVDKDINEIIAESGKRVRDRVRQLVRDFPVFAHALKCVTDLVVGSEIQLQAQVHISEDPASDLDTVINQRIEEAWKRWCDEADVAGKLSFAEIQQLAIRQLYETGEYLVILEHLKRDHERFLPFALQMIEPDRLTDVYAEPRQGNDINQGVEFNKKTGAPVAYWFESENSHKPKRILAKNVVHGFMTLRPGQLRGISPLAPAVLCARDLMDFLGSSIDKAKLHSNILAFVKTPYVHELQQKRTKKSGDKKIEHYEPGTIEYLRPGEDVQLSSTSAPGDDFGPFVKVVLRMIAMCGDVPYARVADDYEGMNYSTMRVVQSHVAKAVMPIQLHLNRNLNNPVNNRFLDVAVLCNRLDLPGYDLNSYHYRSRNWLTPGIDSIDPLKETKADLDAIRACILAPQDAIARRGHDPDATLDKLAAWYKKIKDKGLDQYFEIGNTALANNPAALGVEE